MRSAQKRNWRNQLIIDNAVDYAILTTDMDGRIVSWSSGAQKLFGWAPDEIIGQTIDILFTEEDQKNGVPEKRRRAAIKHRLDAVERWHRRKNGKRFWASGDLQAFYGEDGEQQGFLKIVRDRTKERRQAEQLRISEERVRLATQAAGIGAFEIDLDRNMIEATPQFAAILGLKTKKEIAVSRLIEAVSLNNCAHATKLIESLESDCHLIHLELLINRFDNNEPRWIAYWAEASPNDNDDNKTHRILGVIQDITERKRADEKQAVLTRELAHRVKNILAIVQSIANQTLNNDDDILQVKNDFSTRLGALARAQDILTIGRAGSANLRQIVNASLDIHGGESQRFKISGPPIYLNSQAALSLALTLHELSTNAVKYGALADESGGIRISWRHVNGHFYFTWTEISDRIIAHPHRKGFGSKLMERILPASFLGEAKLTYGQNGIKFQLKAPWNKTIFGELSR